MDRPVHLPKPDNVHEQTAIVLEKHWITQSNLDGLHQLLTWAEGYNAGSPAQKIDIFEPLMFYRSMAEYIRKQLNPE